MYIHTWWWIAWVNFSSSHLIDTLGGFKLQFFRDTFLVGHSVWMVELAFIAVGAFLVVGTGLRQLRREFHFLSKKLIEIGSIAAKRIIRRHKPKKKKIFISRIFWRTFSKKIFWKIHFPPRFYIIIWKIRSSLLHFVSNIIARTSWWSWFSFVFSSRYLHENQATVHAYIFLCLHTFFMRKKYERFTNNFEGGKNLIKDKSPELLFDRPKYINTSDKCNLNFRRQLLIFPKSHTTTLYFFF